MDVLRGRERVLGLPEWLLDHNTSRVRLARPVQALDHHTEPETVGISRSKTAVSGLEDHISDVLLGLGVPEVARDEGEPGRAGVEDGFVQRLASAR